MRRLNPWFVVPVAIAGIAGALIGRNVARVSCVAVDEEAVCDPGTSDRFLRFTLDYGFIFVVSAESAGSRVT